jgi:putative ABC transport system permease protein
LLVLAGIFLKIVLKAELAETGYETDRVAFVNFGWKADFALQKMIRTDYSRMSPSQREAISAQVRAAIQRNKERSERFNRTVLGRSQSLPGVTAFALTSSLPITLPQRLGSTLIDREAYLQGDRTGHGAHRALVSAGYFQVMNVPLLAGRLFDEHDQNLTRPVAVVSDLLARWTWPGENPIGQHFTFYSSGSPNAEPEWVEVVGVVGEVTSVLSEGAAQPFVYVPLEQEQQMLYPVSYLLARGHGNPAGLIVSLQKLVTEADDNIQIMRSRTMNEAISELLYAQRMASAILGTSGLIGLLLACVGLYGVVSYSVARRTREFGIRTAVGAGRSDILRLVIREGTLAAWIGAVLGLLLSITAIRMISHYVVAIPGLEPVSLVAVPLLLGGTVLLACYIPARRAARVDPIVALREL